MTPLTPAEKLVDEVLAKQRAKGRAKYGAGLDAHDGHDWPMEALQELTDATQYFAAELVRLRAELATWRKRAEAAEIDIALSRRELNKLAARLSAHFGDLAKEAPDDR